MFILEELLVKKKTLFLSFVALMLFPFVCIADEDAEKKIKTLDEVVVTATRTAKDIKTVPANVTVITADEIADSGASSIVEILRSQANIHIRTFSGNTSQAQIDLRGFGENGFGRTLVMLDGRRLNRIDLASINWTQLPLEHIERIEIVRGSGSVLYGDAAVAGVIHIITKKGAVEPSISASLKIGEDSFHDERIGLIGSSDRFSYSVSAANQQTDGWRDRTAFKSYGGGFQLGYDISDNFIISGITSYNKTDFEMPGSLTSAELAQDRTQPQPGHTGDESENDYMNANLLLEGSFGNFGDVEINFVYGNFEIITTRPSWFNFNVSDSESIGFQPKYVLTTENDFARNQLVTGVDIYRETLTVDKYSDPTRQNKTHTTDLERDTVGWYVRDEISIGNKFIINGGARIERAEIQGRSVTLATSTIDFDEKKDHDGEVFELGATWLPQENLKFFTRYSTVYRYPFVDEQATFYGFGNDTFLSDIEAEEGRSIDAGIELGFLEDLSVGLTLYQIDMEDEISWNELTFRNENLDDTRHRGMEIFLYYDLGGIFDLQVNYTYQETTFENGTYAGNDVPLVPNHLLAVSLDLELPYSINLIPSLLYVDDSYLSQDFDNNTEKLSDYTVVDLLLRYKNNFGQVELTVFLGIANVFNEEYSTQGTDGQWWGDNTYYPSPGREFHGGISGRF
jgi:iron complex outermembrane receptor protein